MQKMHLMKLKVMAVGTDLFYFIALLLNVKLLSISRSFNMIDTYYVQKCYC